MQTFIIPLCAEWAMYIQKSSNPLLVRDSVPNISPLSSSSIHCTLFQNLFISILLFFPKNKGPNAQNTLSPKNTLLKKKFPSFDLRD